MNQKVLAYAKNEDTVHETHYNKKGKEFVFWNPIYSERETMNGVTHWMPFPLKKDLGL